MDTIDYTTLGRNEVVHRVLHMVPEQLVGELPLMSIEQVEIASSVMTLDQLTAITNLIQEKEEVYRLFPAVLIGIPQEMFLEFLWNIPETTFNLLKRECSTAALQYQLRIVIQEFTEQVAKQEQKAEDINRAIDQIDSQQLDFEKVNSFFSSLESICETSISLIRRISRPLELAWNTERPDFVDKLSYLKEHAMHLVIEYIGKERTGTDLPTGLYALLEEKLGNIYDPHYYDIDRSIDNEPAIEGLSQLGVLRLEDYWQLGLLSSLTNVKQLHPPSHADAEQRDAHKEQIIALVRGNLKKLGLFTIGDLKRAHIYSYRMLRSYVDEYRHLL